MSWFKWFSGKKDSQLPPATAPGREGGVTVSAAAAERSKGAQQRLWKAESTDGMKTLIASCSEHELDAIVDDLDYTSFPLNGLTTSSDDLDTRSTKTTHFAFWLLRQGKLSQADKLLEKIVEKMKDKISTGARDGGGIPKDQQAAFNSAYRSRDPKTFMAMLRTYTSTDCWRIDDFLKQELYDLALELLKKDRQREAATLLDAVVLDHPSDLDVGFWKAATCHNIFLENKSDEKAKDKALDAISRFLQDASENPAYDEKCASLRKMLADFYGAPAAAGQSEIDSFWLIVRQGPLHPNETWYVGRLRSHFSGKLPEPQRLTVIANPWCTEIHRRHHAAARW
jgi:hypothetical protein